MRLSSSLTRRLEELERLLAPPSKTHPLNAAQKAEAEGRMLILSCYCPAGHSRGPGRRRQVARRGAERSRHRHGARRQMGGDDCAQHPPRGSV